MIRPPPASASGLGRPGENDLHVGAEGSEGRFHLGPEPPPFVTMAATAATSMTIPNIAKSDRNKRRHRFGDLHGPYRHGFPETGRRSPTLSEPRSGSGPREIAFAGASGASLWGSAEFLGKLVRG